MNNKEWLNSLSNEELADFLSNAGCDFCVHTHDSKCEPPVYCYDGILQWLEQEREENDR